MLLKCRVGSTQACCVLKPLRPGCFTLLPAQKDSENTNPTYLKNRANRSGAEKDYAFLLPQLHPWGAVAPPVIVIIYYHESRKILGSLVFKVVRDILSILYSTAAESSRYQAVLI
jgi:hypothetical protein